MTKTESEILRLNGAFDSPAMVKSMREFAAQEVEAYKAKLKAELSKRYEAKILQQVEYSHIEQIIDAVK
jgi:hypothetical protein